MLSVNIWASYIQYTHLILAEPEDLDIIDRELDSILEEGSQSQLDRSGEELTPSDRWKKWRKKFKRRLKKYRKKLKKRVKKYRKKWWKPKKWFKRPRKWFGSIGKKIRRAVRRALRKQARRLRRGFNKSIGR